MGPDGITDALGLLRRGVVSSLELVQAAIAAADAVDGDLGAYVLRFDEHAIAAARAADRARARGVDLGPLHGLPIGVKDVLLAVEGPTTAQSRAWDRTWGDGRDADAVARLRAAGAVVTGKTTTMELAIGAPASGEHFPIPRNPWDLDRWAGGSSSGSASGLVAGLFLGSLGTDTGGSIRLPAAFCGVTGLKPTYGRVSTVGVVPLAPTMDHVGPLARSAEDCATLLEVLAEDGWRAAPPARDLVGVRVGVDRSHEPLRAEEAVTGAALEAAVAVLRDLGATVRDVELPLAAEVTSSVLVTLAVEGCATHAELLRTRWRDVGEVTRVRLARGSLVTGADYVQAQRLRHLAQRRVQSLFEDIDVVVMPTVLQEATPIADLASFGPGGRILTPYWNATGNPAIAVPVGPGAGGLPVSMQVAAAPWNEHAALRVATAFQAATDWHRRRPDRIPPPTSEIARPPWLSATDGQPGRAAERLVGPAFEPGEHPLLDSFLDELKEHVERIHRSVATTDEPSALRFDALPR